MNPDNAHYDNYCKQQHSAYLFFYRKNLIEYLYD